MGRAEEAAVGLSEIRIPPMLPDFKSQMKHLKDGLLTWEKLGICKARLMSQGSHRAVITPLQTFNFPAASVANTEEIIFVPETFVIPRGDEKPPLMYRNLRAYAVDATTGEVTEPSESWGVDLKEDGGVEFRYARFKSLAEVLIADYFAGKDIPPHSIPQLHLPPFTTDALRAYYRLQSPTSERILTFPPHTMALLKKNPSILNINSYTTSNGRLFTWISLQVVDTKGNAEAIYETEILEKSGKRGLAKAAWKGLDDRLVIAYLENKISWEDIHPLYIDRWPENGVYMFGNSQHGPQIKSSKLTGKPIAIVPGADRERGYRYFDMYEMDPVTKERKGLRLDTVRVLHGNKLSAVTSVNWHGATEQAIKDWIQGKDKEHISFEPLEREITTDVLSLSLFPNVRMTLPSSIRKGGIIKLRPYVESNNLYLKLERDGKLVATYQYIQARNSFIRSDRDEHPPGYWTLEIVQQHLTDFIQQHPHMRLTYDTIGNELGAGFINALHRHYSGGLPQILSEFKGVPVTFSTDQVQLIAHSWLSSKFSRFEEWVGAVKEGIITDLPDWLTGSLLHKRMSLLHGMRDIKELYFLLPEGDMKDLVGAKIVSNASNKDDELVMQVTTSVIKKMEQSAMFIALKGIVSPSFIARAYTFLIAKELNITGQLSEIAKGMYKAQKFLYGLGPVVMPGSRGVVKVDVGFKGLPDIFWKEESFVALFKHELRDYVTKLMIKDAASALTFLEDRIEKAQIVEERTFFEQLKKDIADVHEQTDKRFIDSILLGGSNDFESNSLVFYDFPNEYQKRGRKILQETQRLANFSQTGSGKTLAAIYAIEGTDAKRTLIFAPAYTRTSHWKEAIPNAYKEAPSCLVVETMDQVRSLLIRHESGNILPEYRYVVFSYEMIARSDLGNTEERTELKRFLELYNGDSVILDEAHVLRNPKAASANSIFSLIRSMEEKKQEKIPLVALTATPIVNRSEDLDMLMSLFYPENFPEVGDFSRACLHDPNVINTTLGLLSFMRWSQKDVFRETQIADIYHTVERVPLSALELKLFDLIYRDVGLTPIDKLIRYQVAQITPLALLDYYPELLKDKDVRAMTTDDIPSQKILKIDEIIRNSKIPDEQGRIEKVLIVSPWLQDNITTEEDKLIKTEEDEIIYKSLYTYLQRQLGDNLIKIDGTISARTSAKDQSSPRDIARLELRNNPDAVGLVISLAVSYGVDLSVADIPENNKIRGYQVIFLGPTLNQMVYEQLLGRVLRPTGKQNIPVKVTTLEGVEQLGDQINPLFDASLLTLTEFKKLFAEMALDGYWPNDEEEKTISLYQKGSPLFHWLKRTMGE